MRPPRVSNSVSSVQPQKLAKRRLSATTQLCLCVRLGTSAKKEPPLGILMARALLLVLVQLATIVLKELRILNPAQLVLSRTKRKLSMPLSACLAHPVTCAKVQGTVLPHRLAMPVLSVTMVSRSRSALRLNQVRTVPWLLTSSCTAQWVTSNPTPARVTVRSARQVTSV